MSDPKRPAVSGIVLAGGGSIRFGSDKLQAVVEGRPLLHLPIEALAQICREIVVVVSGGDAPPMPVGLPPEVRIARDAEPGGGPLVGLIAGLQEAREPIAIVVGADMPGLVPTLLAELARRATAPNAEAAALEEAGRTRPLPAALRRRRALAAAETLRAAGGSSLHALLDTLLVDAIPEPEWRLIDPAGRSLLDVDRPDDLAALAPRLRSPTAARRC